MAVVALFILGYVAIVFEHTLGVNKAATALVTGVACWTAVIVTGDHHHVTEQLGHHMGELSGILFFLLGAMTIVELIDAHDGFELITTRIRTHRRRKLLVVVAILAFFLSAVLDNLTTSIVMMTLVRKLVRDDHDRMYLGGMVIIAANAGGAWSPIGDVTTTMLWVGGQVSTSGVVVELFVPSLIAALVPLAWLATKLKGELGARRASGFAPADVEIETGTSGHSTFTLPADAAAVGRTMLQLQLRTHTGASVAARNGAPVAPHEPLRAGDVLELAGTTEAIASALLLLIEGQAPRRTTPFERRLIFGVGLGVLLFVPVFKTITHLPPFMGLLLGLGVLWTLTEVIHKKKTDEGKGPLSVSSALQRVDAQSVLFFLGILLAISALETAGHLEQLAMYLDRTIGNVDAITLAIGLSSSVVDNVPLVAAAQGMYPLTTFPIDHHFWLFLTYCAGTGGSILIIGSAAGIAVMGIQRITFGWYVRHMALPALVGYAAGAAAFLLISAARS